MDTISCLNLKVPIANSFDAAKRQEIGVHAIGGDAPISHIAKHYQVSRKFVYNRRFHPHFAYTFNMNLLT